MPLTDILLPVSPESNYVRIYKLYYPDRRDVITKEQRVRISGASDAAVENQGWP